MHQVTIRKIWQGTWVSVRCNDVLKGSYSGGLIIRHDNQEMIVSKEICKDRYLAKKIVGRKIQSKFNPNKIYYLIDFRWKPTKKGHGQGELF